MTILSFERLETLTVQAFAKLNHVWPESVIMHGGVFVARIHPNCNRKVGDEDVLVRALVYVLGEGRLCRMTIRRRNIENSGYKVLEDTGYTQMYRECLYVIMKLPVLDLTAVGELES
jgi:hypothetical protein